MTTISLCMIVKNEEKVLDRCLNSVSDLVDEIIIVDTGSTDSTKEIAKHYTDNVLDFKWVDDFSKARNYSFSKATKDYILWLDADDVILEDDRKKFKELKESLDWKTDVVMMKYNVSFDENGNVNFAYYRERLLKREKNFIWQSPIHEVITPSGNIVYKDICITHKKEDHSHSDRNLKIFETMIKNGTTLDARQLYYYARELMYNNRFNEAITYFNIFLEHKDAWIENIINACLDLNNCYLNLDKPSLALSSLFRSFEYDTPRAEICSNIGIHFMQEKKYKIAIYWFKQALQITPDIKSGGFVQLDYYTFIPYINLCVCYNELGDIKKAKYYNNKAGSIKPKNTLYINNKKYFENIDNY